ncbi:MAG: ABC transporter ATP-binding protein [Candidatus Dormibacteria bacterium]
MSLSVSIRQRVGALELDVAFAVAEAEVVAVLGPNGAGKSSLLRAVAGLRPIDSGRIELDGQVLDDPAQRSWVPPERRSVGIVFQDYVLFPHLSVLQNVAFGLRARRVRGVEADREAGKWLEAVGMSAHAAARPGALSGGQRQKVALARALAVQPRLLLLDEPMAALDASARVELRRDLKRHLASFAGLRLLVTHDPLEAMTMADRLVVVENGRVTQVGSPSEVAARPRSAYVAALVGVNLLRGSARGGLVSLHGGGEIHAAGAPDGDVFAVVHPRTVALYRRRPEGSPRNVWAGTASDLEALGDRVRLRIAGEVPLVAEVTPRSASELALAEGGEVWMAVKATEVDVFPA